MTSEFKPSKDDFNLLTFVSLVCRHWRWLVACVALGVCVAGAYVLLRAPIYDAVGWIAVGQLGDRTGRLEQQQVLHSRLLADYGERQPYGKEKDDWAAVYGLGARSTSEQNWATVSMFTVRGGSKLAVETLRGKILDGVKKDHDLLYEKNLKIWQENQDRLVARQAVLIKQEQDVDARLTKNVDPVARGGMMLERSAILLALTEIESQLADFRLRLSDPQTHPTVVRVQGEGKYVLASPGVVMATGLLAGLIVGLAVMYGIASVQWLLMRRRA